MDITPMNVFENQVIPVRIHNLSNFFHPNLAMSRVLALGTKFIPKWDTTKTDNTLKRFNDFKKKSILKHFLWIWIKARNFWEKQKFCLKNNFVPPTEYTAVNNFCWNVRDAIKILFELDIKEKQNLSNKEKKLHNVLIKNRNLKICIYDTDKNLGPTGTDKYDVIKECQRQLYDIITYYKFSWEQAK